MEHDLEMGDRLEVTIGGRGCVSDVQEITYQGNLVISMPMYRIAIVPLKGGEMLQISYYRAGGMYSFMARATRCYRDGGIELVEIEIVSPISKYQRREFIRVDAVIPLDVRLVALPEDIMERTNDEILRMMYDARFVGVPRPLSPGEIIQKCHTIDLSGGGACFVSREQTKRGSLIECTFHLREDTDITADAQIVRADRDIGSKPNWRASVQFVGIDERVRRSLINFIIDRRDKQRQWA